MGATDGRTVSSGIAFIVLGILLAAFSAGRADVGNDAPWISGEVANYLLNIGRHGDAIRRAFAFGILIDAVVVLIVAVATYRLFRDRNALLAGVAAAAFVANGAVSAVADAVGIALTFVGEDFMRVTSAGTGESPVALLELGRAIGLMQLALTQIECTSFAVAEIALGAIVIWTPFGAINPPRFFGWLAIVTGATGILAWGIVVTKAFVSFLVVNTVGTIALFGTLGGWLVLNGVRPPRFPARRSAGP